MTLLEITGLKKSYGNQVILDIPAFSLETGSQTVLAGPSGSGKSTLLSVIAGLLRPDAGSVRLLGEDLYALKESVRDRFRARHLGVLFQDAALLNSCTALENVTLAQSFAGKDDPERALHLLGHLGLGERLRHFPPQLSPGQRQRVALARSLVNRPALLLADEPTAALDPAAAQISLEMIRRSCAEDGCALLIISHDPRLTAGNMPVLHLGEFNRTGK
ncbi:MAG: transporter ATP-binding protein YtrE [Verrucomicrobiota bacterium]|jgi:putative ABC transport system ATP-binding protein